MITLLVAIMLATAQSGGDEPHSTERLPIVRPIVPSATSSTITGRVLDSDCRAGIYLANVLVDGTRLRATTDRKGRFAVIGVPAGRSRLHVYAMGFSNRDTTLLVDDTTVVSVELLLEPTWYSLPESPKPRALKRCERHGELMDVVRVRIAGKEMTWYPWRDASLGFPNGSPWASNEMNVSVGSHASVWGYRCERCVQLRNEWRNGGSWPDVFGERTEGWEYYGIDGLIAFRAPSGLKVTVEDDGCIARRSWNGDGIRIHMEYGPWPHIRPFLDGDRNGSIIAEDALPDIAISDNGDGTWTMNAGFWAPPIRRSLLRVDIEVASREGLLIAGALVGSVRFMVD